MRPARRVSQLLGFTEPLLTLRSKSQPETPGGAGLGCLQPAASGIESSSYRPGARFCGLRPLHLAPLATGGVRRAAPPLFILGARLLSSGSPPPARAHTSPGGALLIKQAARVCRENRTLDNLENLFKILHLRDQVQRTIHLHLPPPLSVFTPLPNAWYSREHRSETLLSGIYQHFF